MAEILNCRATLLQILKLQKGEAEALNFKLLMYSLNEENLKKLKEAIKLSAYKINILII